MADFRLPPGRRSTGFRRLTAGILGGVCVAVLEAGVVKAQVAVISPKAGEAAALQDSTAEAVFRIANQTGSDAAYLLRCSTAGVIAACTAGDLVLVRAGSAGRVPVRYTTREPGGGFVYLHVRPHGGAAEVHAWYRVEVSRRRKPPMVGPSQPRLFVPSNSTGFQSFTITNPNGFPEHYELACAGRGIVTRCDVPGSLSVPPDSTARVSVAFDVAEAGVGMLRLSAAGGGGTATGGYSVTSVAPAVVMPRGGIRSFTAGAPANLRFTLVNPNPLALPFDLVCDVEGAAGFTCAIDPSRVTVEAWSSAPVDAALAASASGSAVVRLFARSPAVRSDSGWIRVIIGSASQPPANHATEAPRGGIYGVVARALSWMRRQS